MLEQQTDQIKASIVIPAFNAEPYIGLTLDSVLSSRTDHSFEILVVDDGSTDRTAEIVNAFDDARITLISIPNSGGPSRPRNVGIEHAKG
jgi:glycosyltransferase involved in cell wall biosynthesis